MTLDGKTMASREDLHPYRGTRVEAFATTNANVLKILSQEVLERFGQPPLSERRIIGIAGPGCVGKSTLAEVFARTLRYRAGYDCDWLDLDGYLIEKALRESSYPIISGYNPKGYELEEARIQLDSWLRNGITLEVKVYNKLTSERTARRSVRSHDLLLVEGVCAFYEPVKDLSTFKIFLQASRNVNFANRWHREKTDLGRSDSEIEQKFQTLYPDYESYILPTIVTADVVLKVEGGYKFSYDRMGPGVHCKAAADYTGGPV